MLIHSLPGLILSLLAASSAVPQHPAWATFEWQGDLLTVDRQRSLFRYRYNEQAWVKLPVGVVDAAAARGDTLLVLREGSLLEYDRALALRGKALAPPGSVAMVAGEQALYFGVVRGPWRVGVVARDGRGKTLWTRDCDVPLDPGEKALLSTGTAADTVHQAVMQLFHVMLQGEEVWLVFLARNLWVRASSEACTPVRWQSPRSLMDPENSRWRGLGPGPLPPSHALSAVPAPHGGVLVLPGLALPQLGNGFVGNGLFWYRTSGELVKFVSLRSLGAGAGGGFTVVGEDVVLWDDRGKVYRWPFTQLFSKNSASR